MNELEIVTAVAAVFPIIVALAALLFNSLVAKLPAARQVQVRALAQDAVNAAEQLANGQSGMVKKQIATNYLVKSASTFGINLHPDIVSAALESAVYNLNASPAVIMSKSAVTVAQTASTTPLSS